MSKKGAGAGTIAKSRKDITATSRVDVHSAGSRTQRHVRIAQRKGHEKRPSANGPISNPEDEDY